jgi:hypothetical protein
MKADVFKKLIKEALREVIREELLMDLSERKVTPSPQVNQVTKYENYKPTVSKPVPSGDPIMDLLQETRYSMSQGEYKELISATSDMVSAPGLGGNPIEQFRQGPEPGLDISQFDFMMRAGDVFKASIEKDKQRFGA